MSHYPVTSKQSKKPGKELVKPKKFIRITDPPDPSLCVDPKDNSTTHGRPVTFDFTSANQKSLSKWLEEEVNAARARGNEKLVNELNGVIICLMQLKNQLSEMYMQEAQHLPVIKVIKKYILGFPNIDRIE